MYSAGFGRVNRTVWHRSTPVGVRFCRENGGEIEGKFDRGGWRVGRAYPNLFSKRPPRIVSTTSTTTRPRTPVLPYALRHPFPFLPACRVPFAPPLAALSPFHLTPHVCGIFLRKIDRPSDCLSRRGFPLCPFRTAPCRACPFLHLPPPMRFFLPPPPIRPPQVVQLRNFRPFSSQSSLTLPPPRSLRLLPSAVQRSASLTVRFL